MPRLARRHALRIGAPAAHRRSTWRAAHGLAAALAALTLILAACGGSAAPASPGSGAGTAAGGPSAAATTGGAEPSAASSASVASPDPAGGTPPASPTPPGSPAAATPPVPSGTPPPRATVVLRDLAFSPATLNITTGTTVVFTNEDTVGHMPALGTSGVAATSPFFAPIDLPVGASATVAFTAPGTYAITCLIHPAMNMSITVR